MDQASTWSAIKDICLRHDLFKGAHPWLLPIINEAHDWPDSANITRHGKQMRPDFSWEFVTQPKVPRRAKSRGQASLSGYIAMIGCEGKIPMRERNIHDFLNCLSFLMFPKSKGALNRRHFLESPEGLKPGQNRTRTQDLLTMFDEGGVIRLIDADQCEHDLIFGHAIWEHVIYGKTLRAARLDIQVDGEILDKCTESLTELADGMFADWLQNQANCLSAQEFSHLWITLDPKPATSVAENTANIAATVSI